MNCAEANQLDMVEWLSKQGHQPQKIRGTDHWYLSPFREEKEASFKVNKIRNVWYDHGLGKGGKLVDFVMEFFGCNTSEALQKIVSFHPQKTQNKIERIPFKAAEKNIKIVPAEGENKIIIAGTKQPITNLSLCNYAIKKKD